MIAGIISGLLVAGIVLIAFSARSHKTKGQAQKAELELKLPLARKDAETAKARRQEKLSETSVYLNSWIEYSVAEIKSILQRCLENGGAATLLLQQVESEQTRYPPLCRLDVTSIGRATIHAEIAPLQENILHKTVGLQWASLAEGLRSAAGTKGILIELLKFTWPTSKLSDQNAPPIVQEARSPQLHSLLLTHCPEDTKKLW